LLRQHELLLKIRDKLTAAHDAIVRLRAVREQAAVAAERARGAESEKAVQEAKDALAKKLTAVEEALYQTKNRASQDPLNYPIRLNNKLAALAGTVASADAAPTAQSYAVYEELAAKIDAELSTLDTVLAEDVPAFNRLVREKDVPAIRPPAR
jgi:kynureninase